MKNKKVEYICQKCRGKNFELFKAETTYTCKDCGNTLKIFLSKEKEKNHRETAIGAVLKFLKKYNTKGWKVLEIGHGYDDYFKNLFERHNMEWFGLDSNINVDSKLMETIKEKIKGRKNYYDGAMEDINMFKDNEFDLVFCCHTFEHSINPIQALKEMKRVSKKFIYIITPYYCSYHILETDPDHLFVLSELQMKRLFEYVQFKEYKIFEQKINFEKNYNLISVGEK